MKGPTNLFHYRIWRDFNHNDDMLYNNNFINLKLILFLNNLISY